MCVGQTADALKYGIKTTENLLNNYKTIFRYNLLNLNKLK